MTGSWPRRALPRPDPFLRRHRASRRYPRRHPSGAGYSVREAVPAMSLEAVRDYLRAWDKDGAVREFSTSSATVELAAAALQVESARIAKTLSFLKGGRLPAAGGGGRRPHRQRPFQGDFRLQGQNARPGSGGSPHRPSGGRRLSFRQSDRRHSLSGRIPAPVRHHIPCLRQRQLRHRADL